MKRARAKKKRSQPRETAWFETRAFPWLLALVYLLTLIVVFREFVFSNFMLYGSDAIQANVYMKTVLRESLLRGDFPEWSPYIFGGMPFVDAFHSDIFYPVSLPVYLLFPVHRALGWVMIGHFWLGGMGMYAAARTWDMSRPAAAIAGLCYMLAPYFISMTLPGHTGRIFVVAWFPIGLLLLKRIWDSARLLDAALFSLTVGLIILTPHVQMAYFSLWAYAGYSLYRIVWQLSRRGGIPWRPALLAMAGVVVALGISAIQFYPSYDYVKNHSPRSGEGLSYEVASSWSLHPEEVVGSVVPEFTGSTGLGTNTYWGRSKVKDRTEYGGLVALLLALWAVFRTRFRDRWFFFGLGAFALLYGLGAHTPLFRVFYHLVPNVKVMRAPAMITLLYLFSISLMAGAAIDSLWQTRARAALGMLRPRFLWIAAFVLTGAAILMAIDTAGMMAIYTNLLYSDLSAERAAILQRHLSTISTGFWLAALIALGLALIGQFMGRRKHYGLLALLAALVIFDLVRVDRQFILPVNYHMYFRYHPVLDFLKDQPQPFRVFDASSYLPRKAQASWVARPGNVTNFFGMHGIPEMTGYHGNQLKTYTSLLGGQTLERTKNDEINRLFDLTDTRYLFFARKANMDGEPDDTALQLVYHELGIKLYENVDVVPHVRLVTCWEEHDPVDTLYARLFSEDFDIHDCVVVDRPLPFASSTDSGVVGTVQVALYEPEEVILEVDVRREALLVLADNAYPAWHAEVDGAPAGIITTNAAFRGVLVKPGDRQVRFHYSSTRQRAGIWITVLSVCAALVWLVIGWRRRQDDDRDAHPAD
jgi:hypothetical protein